MTDPALAASTPPSSAPPPSRGGGWGIDLVGLGALALLIRLPAYFAVRHLTFDDGVFASSVLAMRDGDAPFRDVFSSQAPLFLPLAWLGDLVGGRTANAPRTTAVISGVLCVLALYWVARQLTDRFGAVLVGALAATAGSLLWVTGPLAADGPALLFVVLAFGFTLRFRDGPSLAGAALIGLAVGAALSTKAIEVHILVPAGLVLVAPFLAGVRRGRFAPEALGYPLVAGLVAGAVFVLAALPWGLADVWDQSYSYRADAAVDRDVLANAGKLFSTMWDRDLVVLIFAVVTAVTSTLAYRRYRKVRPVERGDTGWATHHPPADPPGWMPSASLLLVLWLGATVLWLVFVVSPLFRPHVSAMVPPLVLLIGTYRPPWRVAVVVAVLSLPALVVQLDGVGWPRDYSGEEAEIVAVLRELPDGAYVLSDEPGLAWRAGHRTTADLVDPSMLRVAQGRITEESIAAQAADPRVCAVVSRSSDRFGSFEGLPDRLADLGFDVALDFGGPEVVYVRPDCAP